MRSCTHYTNFQHFLGSFTRTHCWQLDGEFRNRQHHVPSPITLIQFLADHAHPSKPKPRSCSLPHSHQSKSISRLQLNKKNGESDWLRSDQFLNELADDSISRGDTRTPYQDDYFRCTQIIASPLHNLSAHYHDRRSFCVSPRLIKTSPESNESMTS